MLLVIVLLFHLVAGAERGEYFGCHVDREEMHDLSTQANSPSAGSSVENCIDACFKQFFIYAGIQDGKMCFCGSSFGRYGPANCTVFCEKNVNQSCGGLNANSVYGTGFFVAGPVQSLVLKVPREYSLTVAWQPPFPQNGIIMQYKVTAGVIFSHVLRVTAAAPLRWHYPNTTFETELSGMTPATQYNVTVWATTSIGEGMPRSAIFWTDIGEPEHPPQANILAKEGSRMTIRLPTAMSTKGPISAYQVIVYDESGKNPLDPARLYNHSTAQEKSLPFYIAAELSPHDATLPFTVGDGQIHGGYENPPLAEDKSYTVVIGAVSELNSVRKTSYSDPAVYRLTLGDSEMTTTATSASGVVPLDETVGRRQNFDEQDGDSKIAVQVVNMDSALVTGLGVAVGVGAILLIASVIIYFLLKRHYHRRRASDHQELTLQSPSSELSENGMASSVLVIDDEGDTDYLFDSLKDKFWQVPRSYLELRDEVLGHGLFGVVRKGVAYRRNQQIPAMVLMTRAHNAVTEREKRNFLTDLDAIIRVGIHANIIGLIGGCDDRDLYHVIAEYYSNNLKDTLLKSRAIDHYPVYAEKQQRITKLLEQQLLEMASGVARGMAHLAHHKIFHRRLTARSIVLADGYIPKVANFGLVQYDEAVVCDYVRWMAMETHKTLMHNTKSDVWGFGVVMWEIFTLGGTPYVGVKSRDVPGRVMRGSRLTQPKNVGDDLYQLMLQCWQVDLDERSTFNELATVLENMVTEQSHTEHLHLELFPGFQYEKYEQELEVVTTSH